jgi:hypothetical protein
MNGGASWFAVRRLGLIALSCALLFGGSSSSAAPLARIQLGFVRGSSVFLASSDGTHQRLVPRGNRTMFNEDPAWSRSGRLAVTEVFFPDEGMGSAGVVVIRPGRVAVDVSGGGSLYDGKPTWAPDSQRITLIGYESVGTLYIDRVGRPVVGITGNKPVDLDPNRESRDDEDAPAWSPDGKTIAFVDEVGPGFGLFLIAPDGSGRRQLTQKRALDPSWSPDGRQIVFSDGQDIDVINADGSGLRRLTATKTREFNPAWSPDGREIAFVRGRSIWLIDVTGAHARRVIQNGHQPAWKLAR